jgi:hypothetical protein
MRGAHLSLVARLDRATTHYENDLKSLSALQWGIPKSSYCPDTSLLSVCSTLARPVFNYSATFTDKCVVTVNLAGKS